MLFLTYLSLPVTWLYYNSCWFNKRLHRCNFSIWQGVTQSESKLRPKPVLELECFPKLQSPILLSVTSAVTCHSYLQQDFDSTQNHYCCVTISRHPSPASRAAGLRTKVYPAIGFSPSSPIFPPEGRLDME